MILPTQEERKNVIIIICNLYVWSVWKVIFLWAAGSMGDFKVCINHCISAIASGWTGSWWIDDTCFSNIDRGGDHCISGQCNKSIVK